MQLRFTSGKCAEAEPDIVEVSSVLRAWSSRAAPFELGVSESEWAMCVTYFRSTQKVVTFDDAITVFRVSQALDMPAPFVLSPLHVRCASEIHALTPAEWLQSRLFIDFQRDSPGSESVVWDLAPSISETNWQVILHFLRVPCADKSQNMFQALPTKVRAGPETSLAAHVGAPYHQFISDRLETLEMRDLLKLGVSVAELDIPALTQLLGCVLAKRVYALPRSELAKVFAIDPKYRNATIDKLYELDSGRRWKEAIDFLRSVDSRERSEDNSHLDGVAEDQN